MQRIEVAPFLPPDLSKGSTPSVLAVSYGKGEAHKDPVIAVHLDEAGRLREHARFDNLIDPNQRADFVALVKRRKPQVIVVGSFTILGLRLMERIQEVLQSVNSGDDDEPPSRVENPPPVIWVPDQVARIYQHSKRAEIEFGSLPPLGRYCAGLARYTQSPLNEYAALGPDLVAITFHEDQQLVCLPCPF